MQSLDICLKTWIDLIGAAKSQFLVSMLWRNIWRSIGSMTASVGRHRCLANFPCSLSGGSHFYADLHSFIKVYLLHLFCMAGEFWRERFVLLELWEFAGLVSAIYLLPSPELHTWDLGIPSAEASSIFFDSSSCFSRNTDEHISNKVPLLL